MADVPRLDFKTHPREDAKLNPGAVDILLSVFLFGLASSSTGSVLFFRGLYLVAVPKREL